MRDEARYARAIALVIGELRAQELLLAANHRDVHGAEVEHKDDSNPDIARRQPEAESDDNRAEVERVAHVGVRARHRQLAIFLDVPGGKSANEDSHGYNGGARRHAPP